MWRNNSGGYNFDVVVLWLQRRQNEETALEKGKGGDNASWTHQNYHKVINIYIYILRSHTVFTIHTRILQFYIIVTT
jgi:hypothetical protein